jgi:hypothetical protein
MTHIRTKHLLAVLLLVSALGCEVAVTAPETDETLQPSFSTSESGFVVTTVQLRPPTVMRRCGVSSRCS